MIEKSPREVPEPIAALPEKRSPPTWIVWWIPIVASLAGGLWTVWTYVEGAQKEQLKLAETRLLEARQPFLKKKLDLFFEAAEVAGKLAAYSPDINRDEWKDEWNKAELRFWALRWSELEMVGNPLLRDAMRRLQERIVDLKRNPKDPEAQHNVRWMAECVADELRMSLEESWGTSSSPRGSGRAASPDGCFQGRDPPPPVPRPTG